MKQTLRFLVIVPLLLAAGLLVACNPVTKEAAQAAPQPAAAATISSTDEIVFGAASAILLADCDGSGACTDFDGNAYTCDDSGTCTDANGTQYTCDMDGNCTPAEATADALTAATDTAIPEEPANTSDAATPEATADTGDTTAPTATPETATAPTTGSGVSAAQINEMVSAHNRWRAEVGVPAIKWSPRLAADSQEWADKLAADGGGLVHSSGPYGENLFGGGGKAWGPTDAVNSWGSEKALYNGEAIDDQNYMNVGHYTQMVWRSTTDVGCGVATSASGNTVWVCRYTPAGNMIGEKPF